MSLLKKIRHPQECKFSTFATRWGTDHEEDALEAYKSIMLSQTEAFDIKKRGLKESDLMYIASQILYCVSNIVAR